MSGATPFVMPSIEETVSASNDAKSNIDNGNMTSSQKQEDLAVKQVLSLSTDVSSIHRTRAPAYRAVLPPQAENKALPLTPAPGYSPSSYGGSPYSDSTTPGCPPHLFSPSSPPMSATPTEASQRRRRKARAPAYLPLDAYPMQSSISPAFATGHRTPAGSASYLPMSGTLPTHTPSLLSPTDSVLNSQTTSPRTPVYQAAVRRSSLAPANSRPADQSHSQVTSPFSATAATTPGFPFSPVPLSAVSVGRPAGYYQVQNAQAFTPEQRAAQEALEAAEARAGSIGGLLAAAASTLSIVSPREASPTTANTTSSSSESGNSAASTAANGAKAILSTILSPASSWSTTSSGNGGWGITSAGPILPGGDSNSGASSRRTSFGDISAPLMAQPNGSNYTVASGSGNGLLGGNSAVPRQSADGPGMFGFVAGVGKKLGNVESDVWRWARGKPRALI